MNTEDFEFNQEIPTEHEEQSELEDSVGWLVNVALRIGAAVLAKVILDSLGL